jgi:hypothetical protein
MIETRIPRVSPERTADLAPRARRDQTRVRPWRIRLWTLLNAQALIRGGVGGPDDAAFAEDDRQRLARRGS